MKFRKSMRARNSGRGGRKTTRKQRGGMPRKSYVGKWCEADCPYSKNGYHNYSKWGQGFLINWDEGLCQKERLCYNCDCKDAYTYPAYWLGNDKRGKPKWTCSESY